jgi:hypothetical protein
MELALQDDAGSETRFLDEGLFTRYGLSGPLALRSSRTIGSGIKRARLNFLPGAESVSLARKLEERRKALAHLASGEFLSGLLPEKIGRMLVRGSGIDLDSPSGSITEETLAALAGSILSWPVSIKGLRPFKEAQVTAGGVDMAQVQPESLESSIVPRLFFCGEVLDVDGDSGGYNLQWCWSSGWAAGTAAVAQ